MAGRARYSRFATRSKELPKDLMACTRHAVWYDWQPCVVDTGMRGAEVGDIWVNCTVLTKFGSPGVTVGQDFQCQIYNLSFYSHTLTIMVQSSGKNAMGPKQSMQVHVVHEYHSLTCVTRCGGAFVQVVCVCLCEC